MSSGRVDQQLSKAMAKRHHVRVFRGRNWDELSGHIAGMGEKWVLIADLDDRIRPAGFCAVRRRDIGEVRRLRSSEAFVRDALDRHGNWPSLAAPRGVGLDRTRDLVAGLAGTYNLLTLLVERQDPHICFVGRPRRVGRRSVDLQEISPNAEWATNLTRYRFGDVTRIDVGDGYSEVLLEIGGPPHPL